MQYLALSEGGNIVFRVELSWLRLWKCNFQFDLLFRWLLKWLIIDEIAPKDWDFRALD